MQKNSYQPNKGNIINQTPTTGSRVIPERKYETFDKFDDNIIATNNKLIKLIELIQTSICSPITDITYDLDLLSNELQEENYNIKSEKGYI